MLRKLITCTFLIRNDTLLSYIIIFCCSYVFFYLKRNWRWFMEEIFQVKNERKMLVRCSVLVGSYVQLLHTRVPSLLFFKTNIRISRTSFSENTSKNLLLYLLKMVQHTDARVDTALSMVYPQ